MGTKSTATRYGKVAVIIHWLSALLIIGLMISGNLSANFTDPAAKAQILAVHAPVGITILLLTLFRIFWWWKKDKKPGPVAMPKWQELSALTVQKLFYVVIILMSASGIGMLVLSGAGPIIFGGAPGDLPDFSQYPPRAAHGIGARVMIVLFLAHIGGAIYHQFIKKDGLFWRMWFSK